MVYKGIDRWNVFTLQHINGYKYVAKVKTNKGYRYFYTVDEYKAYLKDTGDIKGYKRAVEQEKRGELKDVMKPETAYLQRHYYSQQYHQKFPNGATRPTYRLTTREDEKTGETHQRFETDKQLMKESFAEKKKKQKQNKKH